MDTVNGSKLGKKALSLVILDASFLMLPFNLGIDILTELDRVVQKAYKPTVLRATLEELEKLQLRSKAKQKKAANLAMQIAMKCNILEEKRSKENETVDDCIVKVAQKHGCVVATVDNELRKRLREKQIPVVFLRQKSRLELDGVI